MSAPLRRLRPLVIASAASLLATSCAMFPKNQLPKVTGSAPASASRVAVSYTMNSAPDPAPVPGGQPLDCDRALEAAFKNSGRFSSVAKGSGGTVHVDARMTNYGNKAAAGISGFVSGLSLGAIPGVASDQFKLTAQVRGINGRSRRYVLEDGTTFVIWIPMVFAMFSNNPSDVLREVQENMCANLVVEMAKDGMLPR